MNRFSLSRIVSVLGVVLVMALSAIGARADINPWWNVGSGQTQRNFQMDSDLSFGGGTLVLGMRAVHRQSADDLAVSGNTYTAFAGFQTAGEAGAPVTNMARNRWNFDYHVYWSGGVQNLDSITMAITSPAGNTVSATSFDMKLMPNDNTSGLNPEDPAFYIQDSQNPVFFPWFVPTFNMNVTGLYTFTLTAVEGSDTLVQTMNINVVTIPAPAGAAVLGLGALATIRRSKRRAA